MTTESQKFTSNQRVKYVVSTLYDFRMIWLLPAIAGLMISAFYVLLIKNDTWSARQSLIVRDDLLGQSFKPGRFESLESMKAAQETILEIARKPQVIRKALEKLGPESVGLFGSGSWPSEKVIEEMQGDITLSAPNGAELGKTEVIVLNVKGSTRERTRTFISLLLDEISVKTKEVRQLRLQSMVTEMTQARNASWNALEQSKSRLRDLDKTFGNDIGTFAYDDQGGSGGLQKDISQIQLEKRNVETDLESATKVLEMLVQARQNPNRAINTSADLIKFQPSLDTLMKERIAAQGVLSRAIGNKTPDHPVVKSARESIVAIKTAIYNELPSSIVGLKQDISALRMKANRLDLELGKLTGRLTRVSSGRVDSLTLLAEVKKRTEMANNAESDLQEIQALAATSDSVDLVTLVDEPQVPTRPEGMGNKATVMAGGIAGLMLGLGLVLLLAPSIDEQVSFAQLPPINSPTSSHSPSPITKSPAPQQPSASKEPTSPNPMAGIEIVPKPSVPVTNPETSPNPVPTGSQPVATEQPIAEKPVAQEPIPVLSNFGPKSVVASSPKSAPAQLEPIGAPSAFSDAKEEVAAADAAVASAPAGLQTLEQKADEALSKVKLKSKSESSADPSSAEVKVEAGVDVESRLRQVNIATIQVPPMKVSEPDETCQLVDEAFESELAKKQNPFARVTEAAEPMEPSASDDQIQAIKEAISKRSASVRPATLVKQDEDVGESDQPNKPSKRAENPFLKKRAANSGSESTTVPDQIKKLSAAISSFAKPINRKRDESSESF